MSLKRFAFLFIAAIAISGCGDLFEDDGPQHVRVPADVFRNIEVPFRDSSYGQLNDTVIRSAAALEVYLDSARNYNYANIHIDEGFISALDNATIDFEEYNLVLYFHTENSGSIHVSTEPAYWKNPAKTKVHIRLWRGIPPELTADMAYYAFAYIVKKEIEEVFIERTEMDPLVIVN